MIRQPDMASLFLRFSNLAKYQNIVNFISTREGGVSTGKFETLNLSLLLEPEAGSALRNRKLLFDAVGVPLDTLTLGRQTHSSNVTVVTPSMVGRGSISYQSALPDTDALITSSPNITIAVLIADCTPVLLFDPTKNVIGAIHAGRMGTIAGITLKAVEAMVNQFDVDSRHLIAGIGPSICAEHYAISKESQHQVIDSLGAEYLIEMNSGAVGFDLKTANKDQLISAGVQPKNIEVSGHCTFEDSGQFFSERRDGKPTGRFCAAISMISPD